MINNRQQQQNRRGRGRTRNPQNNGGRNESGSRIDSRARNNAPQMLEKFKNLARDAQMQGDRVMTEYYLQFADHYFRIVAEQRVRYEETRRDRDDWQEGDSEERPAAESLDSENGDEGDDDYQRQAPRQQQNRPQRDNRPEARESRPRDDRPREDRPREDRQREDRPRNDRNRDDRPRDGNRYANGNNRDTSEEDSTPATLDISVLPPAFASDGPMVPIDLDDAVDEAPAPRRRGRPRKSEVVEGDAA